MRICKNFVKKIFKKSDFSVRKIAFLQLFFIIVY